MMVSEDTEAAHRQATGAMMQQDSSPVYFSRGPQFCTSRATHRKKWQTTASQRSTLLEVVFVF